MAGPSPPEPLFAMGCCPPPITPPAGIWASGPTVRDRRASSTMSPVPGGRSHSLPTPTDEMWEWLPRVPPVPQFPSQEAQVLPCHGASFR